VFKGNGILQGMSNISLEDIYVQCPVCEEQIQATMFAQHTLYQHPHFFVVWASMNMPTVLQTDVDDEEELSYEYLLNLCDTIGYHKVGVKDIDMIAPKCNTCEKEEMCPICLESVNEPRKTEKCNHTFCSLCLEKWLSENKTCPLCIQRLEDDES
jgi:hypothetical protein